MVIGLKNVLLTAKYRQGMYAMRVLPSTTKCIYYIVHTTICKTNTLTDTKVIHYLSWYINVLATQCTIHLFAILKTSSFQCQVLLYPFKYLCMVAYNHVFVSCQLYMLINVDALLLNLLLRTILLPYFTVSAFFLIFQLIQLVLCISFSKMTSYPYRKKGVWRAVSD